MKSWPMAEQELAESTDEMAAAMAAAAVAAQIDDISRNRDDDVSDQSAGDDTGSGRESAQAAAEDGTSAYITIKELRSISRARSLRLQPDDVIVAIDGVPFDKDIETFLDIMFECDPDNGRLLTVWRNGVLFNVIARGPLGCALEHTKPEIAEKATEDFGKFTVDPIETYVTFEVLRDIFRNCVVIDTRLSPMAMIFPPLWLMQHRLWEVLIATFLIYGTTLAVHWVLFIIAYIILSIYFRKAHLVIRRSFAMMRGRHIWMVVAEKSEQETQRLCRRMDPKCIFVPDLVGPPVVDEPPKKKRRRRASN
jgi:hypothetical protein